MKHAGSNWRDRFRLHQGLSRAGWIRFVITLLAAGSLPAFASGKEQVVVYCAQDEVFAEPILRDFEKETGIKVRPVYDSEAVKTVGLANRLIAERSHPQCDVFWGNEEMRTRQLAEKKIFRPDNGWAAFGARSRRIAVNTNLLKVAEAPKSLLDLTNARWRGKVAIAYPQFGTTAAQFHALRQLWGEQEWESWCRGLAANQVRVVDGNSFVARAVGSGETWIGLTDSDDIKAAQREGLPIAALPIGAETLLIPNTVAVIANAPHPGAAEKLFSYLQRPEVIQKLVASGALESAGSKEPGTMTLSVNWSGLLRDLGNTTAQLNHVFLR